MYFPTSVAWLFLSLASAQDTIPVLTVDQSDILDDVGFEAAVDALELLFAEPVELTPAEPYSYFDPAGYLYDFRGERRYRLTLESGFIEYRHLGRFLAGSTEGDVPVGDLALARAEEVAALLAVEGLLVTTELDVSSAQIQEFVEDRGGATDSPAVAIGTKVGIPRSVQGIPVFGQGLRVWLGGGGEVDGVDVFWRGSPEGADHVVVSGTLDGARVALADLDPTQAGATRTFSFEALAYPDLDEHRSLSTIEPAWVFMFRTHAPPPYVSETNDVIAGKERFRVLSAVGVPYRDLPVWAYQEQP